MLDSYFQTCENSRTSRTKCSFWRFKGSRWEVIFAFRVAGAYFRGVSRSACCFCVAGTELSAHAFWSKGAVFSEMFGGIKIEVEVPLEVNDELTGLPLNHEQVVEGMKTEVKQLETLKVGRNMTESEARKISREKGAKILTSRWVLTHLIFFNESQCQGSANVTQCQKSWQAQHFVTALKSCGSLAKSDTFGAL